MTPAPGQGEGHDARPGGADERVAGGNAGRDRDAAGRPRNARPRDGLGRPLPRPTSASRSAPADRPAPEATDPVPDDLDIGPADAIALARSLLAEGRPFHAHEVFEAMWKSGPAAERELWQGLAQLAVGITHARRGNAAGAVTLLRRGADLTDGYTGQSYGVSLTLVIAQSRDIAARIERGGLPAVSDADLRFPL